MFEKNSIMKPKAILLFTLILTLKFPAFAQGTAFTYQGKLNDSAGLATGSYDFRFRIAADSAGNNLVAGPLLTNAVPVNNGLFTLTLDFGAGLFIGSNYWLQVDVKTNGAASYTTLTPLQALTPSPYAIFANGASNVFGAVAAAQLSGTIASPQLTGAYSNPLNLNNAANQFSGTFNGNGGALSNVNAATLGGLASSNFWQTAGNSGTTPNANFLGTTDNQPLELRVNGQRVLRLTPNSNGGPNFLGGSSVNFIAPGVVGGIIVGGGAASYFGSPYTNSIASDFDIIGGGGLNSIGTNSPFASIVGGSGNQIGANDSYPFIGGGTGNQIGDSSGYSTISGGLVNRIGTNSLEATIGGGDSHIIGANASGAAIGGGAGNRILDGSAASTIAGGNSNQIMTNSTFATIAGGLVNHIGPSGDYSVIGGGNRNNITNSQYATIGGGNLNLVSANSSYAVIAGGYLNNIQPVASYSAISGGGANTNAGAFANIGGGEFNQIQIAADHALIAGGGNNTIVGSFALPVYDTIGGGFQNTMQTNSSFSVIAGGQGNIVQAGAAYSTISGGSSNIISGGALNATIAGGTNNVVTGTAATVVGGFGNVAGGPNSTVLGGLQNNVSGFAATAMGQNSSASGNYSLAAGYGAQATNQGAFVWSDLPGFGFSSTNDNSFNVHAGGGVRLVTGGAGMSLDGPLNVSSGAISGNGSAITNIDAGTITTGTLSNSRLSTNVALRAGGNTLTGDQILASGKLSLGANTAGYPLEVHGQLGYGYFVTSNSPNGSFIILQNSTPSQSQLGGLAFYNSAATYQGGVNYLGSSTAGTLSFVVNTSEQMRIDSSGRVGIGTSSPTTALHVRDTSDTEFSIQSNDVGAHRWTIQSSGVTGNANLDASFQIIDRTSNNSRFLIGTNGFVGIGTSGPTNRLHVNGGVSAIAFVPTSDRNAKENFEPISPREVLNKVAALPISTWDYKDYQDGRHMGPMAQDFYEAFHLGGSEKTITTVDPDGVALAAIQGLNEKVESASHKSEERIRELEAENADLKRRFNKENADLRRRLEALETVLISQKSN
jgi:trimeric autotransporter adhesin